MYFIWYILIGILAGFIAGKIMRVGGFGILINCLLYTSTGQTTQNSSNQQSKERYKS